MGIHIMPPLYEMVIKLKVIKEYHSSPLLGKRDIAAGSEIAQSFTPQCAYQISQIEVPLLRIREECDGIIHIQIRTNDVDHPSETILWEDTISVLDLPYTPYDWFPFLVSGVSAEKDIPLWIVEFWTDYTYWFYPPYSASDSGNLYLRGESLSRPAAGEWVGYGDGQDLGFKT